MLVCLTLIGKSNARLGLAGDGQTVVQIAADAQVEEPVAGFDLILDIKGQFLHVGVPDEVVKTATAGQVVWQQGPRR